MSVDNPTCEWHVDDIGKMLALLPIIDSLDFQPYVRSDLPDFVENGTRTMQMSDRVYHKVVDRMWKLLYETSAFIDPYAPLPEDPAEDGVPFAVMGAYFPSEYFETATLNQVRRYLVLCTRGEHFSDGYIASEFESGSVQAAFRRLRHLRDSM